MKRFLRELADSKSEDSLATRLRRKRFAVFCDVADRLSKNLNRPLQVLDIGGTQRFWEMMGYTSCGHHITLLNITSSQTTNSNMTSVVGDARHMPQFADGQFDIAFSNSVIEHLGTWEDQRCMADEVRRVASRYLVQTPNFFFPLEPHFLFPFIHWLPRAARIWLVHHFSLGWYKRARNAEESATIVDQIRMMRPSELKALFPDAVILRERFLGLTKSLIVVKR